MLPYGEWGVSGSLRIAPDPSGRGASLSMTPSWGAERQGGRLWRAQRGALAPADEADALGRLQAEFGYGLAAFGGGFTSTPNLGPRPGPVGVGSRLAAWLAADPDAAGFEVNLDATRVGSRPTTTARSSTASCSGAQSGGDCAGYGGAKPSRERREDSRRRGHLDRASVRAQGAAVGAASSRLLDRGGPFGPTRLCASVAAPVMTRSIAIPTRSAAASISRSARWA